MIGYGASHESGGDQMALTPVNEKDFYQDLKSRVHRSLIARLDLDNLEVIGKGQLQNEIIFILNEIIAGEGVPLSQAERERLLVDVQNEIFGLGPLEPLSRTRR